MIRLNNLTLSFILLSEIFILFLNSTTLQELQILLELIQLSIYFYLLYKIKLDRFEVFSILLLLFTLGISIVYLSPAQLLVTFKNLIFGFLPIIILPKTIFNNSLSKQIINIFIFLNIFLTILPFKPNLFVENTGISSDGGGLFQNFHVNAFITSVWIISSNNWLTISGVLFACSIFLTASKSIFASYFLSLIYNYKNIFFIKIKQIDIFFYKLFFVILFFILIILFINNFELIEQYVLLISFAIRDKSAVVLFDQLFNFDLFKDYFTLFPSNIDDSFEIEYVTESIKRSAGNEIAIYSYIKMMGFLNLISFSTLIFKNCKKLIPFFILTSLHYSYLLTPLVYLIYFTYNPSDNDKNI